MNKWISYNEPETTELNLPIPDVDGVRVLVRREYLNHQFVSGNKWWKLKYNLMQAADLNQTVMTFGGAYSNHIYATAAACRELEIESIGIIRGEAVQNETLLFAKKCGMRLHFISREDYRKKDELNFLASLQSKFGNVYLIPEGGTNNLAVRGCRELGEKILSTPFDYLMLPVGTGGTIAGIIKSFRGRKKIIGVPVLKDGNFLFDEIKKWVDPDFDNWDLSLDYHQGGYAKTNNELNKFITDLEVVGVTTEFVYTGKLFWAAADLIKKKIIEPGATVLILHTGGLRNH